jgi:hypothetical protein
LHGNTRRAVGHYRLLLNESGRKRIQEIFMGDRGKKDKDKNQKQKQIQQQDAAKAALAKQPAKVLKIK